MRSGSPPGEGPALHPVIADENSRWNIGRATYSDYRRFRVDVRIK
jgi:hypothetical protein